MGLSKAVRHLAAAAGLGEGDRPARDLWTSVDQRRFPGALMPARISGAMTVYAAAETPTEWRRLRPLLLAFAGPTVTDYDGLPCRLDASVPFEDLLLREGFHAVARLRPGSYPRSAEWMFAALRRLRDSVAAAPRLASVKPEPTSVLLARLQDAVNAADPGAAWDVHALLAKELRLDALNLLQLEMQILAASGRWRDMRLHPGFETLCLSAPNPATATILLEAIRDAPEVPAPGDLREASAARRMDAMTAVLRASADPESAGQPRRAPANDPRTDDAGAPPAPSTPPTRLGEAKARLVALLQAPADGDQALEAEAQTALAALSVEEKAGLEGAPLFRALLAGLLDLCGDAAPPRNWREWAAAIARPAFKALVHAARGPAEWRLRDEDVDPIEAAALADAFLGVPEGLASERLATSWPYVVRWLVEDPRWPRTGFGRLYSTLLLRMALDAARGEETLRSATPLLEGALRTGTTAADYRQALEAAREIARAGLGRGSAYAALELVDAASGIAAADEDALAQFVLGVLSDVASIRGGAGRGVRLVAAKIGAPFGWIDAGHAEAAHADASTWDALKTSYLGIHTLTESAGRQAGEALALLAPGIRIHLSHDHVGTGQLAAASRNVDLFVIAAGSAKHAATEFIRAKRGDGPIAYAAGRGSASLLRAVEKWAETRSADGRD